MSNHARKRIFNRLNSGVKTDTVNSTGVREFVPKEFSQIEKKENLKSLMVAMRAEVHLSDSENWIESLTKVNRYVTPSS